VGQPSLQLFLQTSSLIVGFMVWVILSSLMPFISEDISLNAQQLTWVAAAPVILGSLLRIPLGYWANRFGARTLFFISFLILLIPVYWISRATTFIDLLFGGLLLGIGGAVFSIGVTSIPKYFPKEKHGFVNGVYGAGNIGTALTAFLAPVLAVRLGWAATVQLFLVLLGVFALLNFLIGDRKEPRMVVSFTAQLKEIYRNEKLWFLCFFYFITFGSFVAFTVYLPNFLVTHFQLTKVDAGFRTAGFITLATIMRPVGGWLADRLNSFVMLMFVFAGFTIAAILLSFMPDMTLFTIGCLSIAVCAGIGNGTVFKLVPLYFSKQSGIVNGLVSAMGGLGGFFPPLILTMVFNVTGHYAIGFMALSEFSLASLILVMWMYFQENLSIKERIFETTGEGIMLTDTSGRIRSVNPAFTRLTGFDGDDVIGKTPQILNFGKMDEDFYDRMWKEVRVHGRWKGEVWSQKRDTELALEWLPIENDGGEVQYYAAMFSDLSETEARE